MALNFVLLFVAAMAAGLLALVIPNVKQKQYKLMLVFGGAYLFSITIIHILPELYSSSDNPTLIGVYVLGGFFLQQFLEYFTAGAEHGHIHTHDHGHKHGIGSSLLLLIALMIHSFLEGALLIHPGSVHVHHDTTALLTGIILHKAPAAFALMSILLCQTKRSAAIIFLTIFALGSPLGMLLSEYMVANNIIVAEIFTIIFAVVCGNFLHISTTIVFESSVDHSFNAKKIGVALLGAFLAVGAEFLL